MADVRVYASIDAYINGKSPNANYGSQTYCAAGELYVGGAKSNWWRAIADFDVSPLQGLDLTSLKMRFNRTALTGQPFDAYLSRCTRPGQWTENGVTWNNYDGVNPWTTAGGDFDDTGPPAKITFTVSEDGLADIDDQLLLDFLQDAIDNRSGVLSCIIRNADEGPGVSQYTAWRTKESADPDRWSLIAQLASTYTPTVQPRRTAGAHMGVRRPRSPGRARPPAEPSRGRRPPQGHRPEPAEGRKPWAP